MADASRWTDVAILMWGPHMIGRRHGRRLSLLSFIDENIAAGLALKVA
jgi:hypothetical protein